MPRKFKIRLFSSTVESVLLYGSETWTLTKELENKLNGCYTRLLRSVLGCSWRDHITNETLYGDLPKVTDKIRNRRLKLTGHCLRHPGEMAHNLVLWTPYQGTRKRGKPPKTFVQLLEKDTGLSKEEIGVLAMDRCSWRIITGRDSSTVST